MSYFHQFIIPVTGLKPGVHQFDYEIEDTFFDHFDYSEIRNGSVVVHLGAEKEETLVVFHISFKGVVAIPCDRCSESFDLAIGGEEKLIVKFGNDFHEESEEVQVVPIGENHFDISPFIYEYLHLALPARRVHPEDAEGGSLCDPEAIRRLNTRESTGKPDPRWEVLSQLKKKR